MKKILKWLDNFWYHNKWLVLIGGFFAVAVIIMTMQFFTRDGYDAMVLYTGPRIPNANQTLEIQNAFESVMTKEYDENGEKEVALSSLFLMTDEQLKDDRYLYDEAGNKLFINTGEMVTTKQQFTTQIFVGEAMICLLDPAWYELAAKKDAFVELSELTDVEFEDSYDECALYLHKTDFGEYFTAMDVFPEDTLICFRRMSSTSGLKNEKKEAQRYEYNKGLFCDIIEFSIG